MHDFKIAVAVRHKKNLRDVNQLRTFANVKFNAAFFNVSERKNAEQKNFLSKLIKENNILRAVIRLIIF